MIADLKPYPAYRESGLPWLGSCPNHWSIRRTKILFRERAQKGFPNESLLAATQTKGVVRKEDYGTRTVTASKDLHLLKLVEVGDYVISLRSFQGGIEVAHYRGIISPAYTVLKPQRDAESGYFSYFFKSAQFIQSLSLFVTGIREGQNIDYSRLSRAELPLPPREEQAAIVGYLDWACGRLDRAIRAKRKVIALLNEQKQAVIHRAVTRGLNSSAPLMPSGASWLGDIPVGWAVLRAKYLFREIDERSTTGSEELLSVSHLTGVTPRSQKNITMFKAESYVGHKLCSPGDLVINTMWAWMGALGISKDTGIISPAYAVYRQRGEQRLSQGFIDALLRTRLYIDEFTRRSTGIRSSRLRMYPEEFFKVEILMPPRSEQEEIVSFISTHTANLNVAIERVSGEVDLLREYRTRLIADVVTGKLDVREAAAKLPDAAVEPETALEQEPEELELEEELVEGE
jgi:type I restriction enzyme S subunit